jgi:WD40 repeat protein
MLQGQRLVLKTNHGVASVAFSPRENILAVGAAYRDTVALWNTKTGKLIVQWSARASRMHFSNDGRTLETGSYQKKINLWDIETEALRTTLTGFSDFVYDAAFSSDNRTLAVASGGASLWDVSTGQLRIKLDLRKAEAGPAGSVAFSSDGLTLATANFRTVYLWNSSTGELKRSLVGHVSTIYEIAFSPNGRFLATGSRDNTARLWEVETGKPQYKFAGYDGKVHKIAFSPDGRILAVSGGYKHNETKLWDVASGKLIATLPHKGRVWSLAFSPNGSLVATATENEKTVKLWDPNTGKLKATLDGAHYPLAFSPDGRTLATAGGHDTVILWEVPAR